MEKIIACCGLNCAKCDARIATVTNNNELLIQTTEKWKVNYKADSLTPEMVKCTGCREQGAKMSHCPECDIRNCANSKNYKTCAACDTMETCSIVGKIHSFDPSALENLKSLS